jgi:hypothetical protein
MNFILLLVHLLKSQGCMAGTYMIFYRQESWLATGVKIIRFEVYTAVTMKNAVLWDVPPYG